MARDPALERAILDAPDDPAPYLVYADWLSTQGDARGELIAVSHALATDSADDPDAARQREAALLASNLFGEPINPELATFTWQWGFVRGVRLFNFVDWMDSSFDVAPLVETIFSAPVSIAVRELRLGVIRWMENGEDVPAILASVAERGAAERIETVVLGDVHDIDCDLGHHPLGDVSILGSYSNLRELTLHGSDFRLGDALDFPHLRSLTIETCGLSADDVRAIAKAHWPALESLTLWFGSEDYGSDSSVEDLAGLLAGDGFPALRRLALANAEHAGEIAAAIGDAPITARLTELDLSMGTLDDSELGPLLEAADKLRHLERLDVNDNFLSGDGLAALSAIGPEIISDEQKELDEEDEDWRYVSMPE